ncbi:MAG: FtsX-like permease family protein [Geminicoccaceae bacterium]|nr:FtsX-like permease family protein [Geminicoccaceae bacterium]
MRAGAGGAWNLGALWRIAWRDLRGSSTAALIILGCLTLGVATITGIGSLRASLTDTLERDARALLGGDLVIESTYRELPPEELRAIVPAGATVAHTIATNAIAFADNGRQVPVALKSIDGAYPLYGVVGIEPLMTLEDALADGGALVEAALLQRLAIAVGDSLALGNGRVTVRGVLTAEPDQIGGFVGLGPRVMIDRATLDALDILAPGALVRHKYGLALADRSEAGAYVATLRRDFPEAAWRAQTFNDVQPRIARNADRLAGYLSLAGIAALLVGGLGVGIVVDAHLQSRRRSIATFRCVGMTTRDVFLVCGLQVLLLCCGGLVLGAALGTALPFGVHLLPAGLIPIDLAIGVQPGAILAAALFASATAALFTVLPLLKAVSVTPAALFRDDALAAGPRPLRRQAWPWLLGLGLVLVLTALLAVPAPHVAVIFLGIVLVAALAMAVLARLGLEGAGWLARHTTGMWRLALGQLRRAERMAVASVVALAAGTAVLTTVLLVENGLSRELLENRPMNAPSTIFIDIQGTQRAEFEAVVGAFPDASVLQMEPVLRARVVKIAGVPVDEAVIAEGARWTVRRDRGLSYRAAPPEHTTLVAGEWWPADYAGPPLVSMEDDIALGYGIGVGDTVTFNVLGRLIEAEVANLRPEIDWSEGRIDFVFVLSPGVIDQAPHTLVATVDVPKGEQAALLDRMARELPNVTPFAIDELIAKVADILDKIGLAVRVMAAVTLVTGLAVLTSALVAARREQLRQAVLLKVVGAERRQIGGIFLGQYAAIGVVASLLGALLGLVASFAVLRFAFGLPWHPSALPVTVVPVVAVLATLLLGALGLRHILAVPAALILRER